VERARWGSARSLPLSHRAASPEIWTEIKPLFYNWRENSAYSAPVKNETQHNENARCSSCSLDADSLDAGRHETPAAAQILGVKRRGVNGTSAAVEVEMALRAARGEVSNYWRLTLKSYYADGAVDSAVVRSTEALTLNPVLFIPALSTRDGRSPIAGLQAEMIVNFANALSMMKYQEFAMPRPDDDIYQRVTMPIEIRPHVIILDARPAGERFIEVKWDACAPPPAIISRFDVCLSVAHTDGLMRRARQSAKSCRTLIGVEPHSAPVSGLGVGLSATVAWFGSSAKDVDEAFGY
jgi:hypothetical protein